MSAHFYSTYFPAAEKQRPLNKTVINFQKRWPCGGESRLHRLSAFKYSCHNNGRSQDITELFLLYCSPFISCLTDTGVHQYRASQIRPIGVKDGGHRKPAVRTRAPRKATQQKIKVFFFKEMLWNSSEEPLICKEPLFELTSLTGFHCARRKKKTKWHFSEKPFLCIQTHAYIRRCKLLLHSASYTQEASLQSLLSARSCRRWNNQTAALHIWHTLRAETHFTVHIRSENMALPSHVVTALYS